MAILRIKKKISNFVILDKTFLEDKRLSWKAKGLLAYLLSKPDDWQLYVEDLVKHSPDRHDAVYSIINQLKALGYIHHYRERKGNGGFVKGHYLVLEIPQMDFPYQDFPDMDETLETASDVPHGDFPVVVNSDVPPELGLPHRENPVLANPDKEKPRLLSNNKYNNNKTNKEQTTASTGVVGIIPAASKIKHKPHITAAAVSSAEKILGTTLTESQRHCIQHLVFEELVPILPISSPQKLCIEIEMCLLDKGSFSQAGNDFFRKVNTITKCIRAGKWRAPVATIPTAIPEIASVNAEIKTLQATIQQETINATALQHRIDVLLQSQDDSSQVLCHSFQKELQQKKTLLQHLRRQLDNLLRPSISGDLHYA